MFDLIKNKLSDFQFQKRICYFLLILGVLAKLVLLPVKTGDSVHFLKWIEFIKSHDYISSLKYTFYDYAPSYIYILILIAKIGLNPLYSIKIASIFFEYLAAFFIGKIAEIKYKSTITIWISMAVIPLLPTIMLNSSYFTQCDSIYTAFMIGSIFFILKKKQFLSVLFLGLAIAFKMQAVILLPFFFVLLLRKNIRWYYFLIVPVVFLFSLMPAWFTGRSLIELLNVYVLQTDHFRYLTLNFPNLYIWISNDYYQTVKITGMLFTFFTTLFSGIWLVRKKIEFTFEQWIRLAFLSSIFIPFILPGMHERYMYMGDVLGILYFLVLRKNIHLPLGILIVSLYSYIRCSRFNDVLPMWPAFFVYLSVIILSFIDFFKSFSNESKTVD